MKTAPAPPWATTGRLYVILTLVGAEVIRAQQKFPPYHSAHEGSSIIREEFEELWDEVKNNKAEGAAARQMQEALQVAATAIRFIYDLGTPILTEIQP